MSTMPASEAIFEAGSPAGAVGADDAHQARVRHQLGQRRLPTFRAAQRVLTHQLDRVPQDFGLVANGDLNPAPGVHAQGFVRTADDQRVAYPDRVAGGDVHAADRVITGELGYLFRFRFRCRLLGGHCFLGGHRLFRGHRLLGRWRRLCGRTTTLSRYQRQQHQQRKQHGESLRKHFFSSILLWDLWVLQLEDPRVQLLAAGIPPFTS
jgi:hypothetical protein